ncbi:MAG TPA: SpoIIE family protein phosphatase, partial [Ignavibacteriaceae bacterium]
ILRLSSGQVLIVSVVGKFFVAGSGEVHFLFSIQDISQLLALEQERDRSDSLLFQAEMELKAQKIALDEHALVSIADLQGNIIYANSKFSDVSGYSQEELLGQNHRIVKSSVHPQSVYEEMWSVISSGNTWHGEIANRKKNGEIYWVSSTIVPWLDKSGLPYRYISIRTDITSRIEAQEDLAKARSRELEIGSNIQTKLLFGKLPENLASFDVQCYSEASQGVDGDFYTFTKFDDEVFEVLTGDVMGKGVTAALIGAGVKNSYRQVMAEMYAQNGIRPTPVEIIQNIHKSITPELIEIGAFVTMSLVRFDRREKKATWVNAGHPSILYSDRESCKTIELHGNNLPLGVIREEIYEENVTNFQNFDFFFLYSDGLPEATDLNHTMLGVSPLMDSLSLSQQNKNNCITSLNMIKDKVHLFSENELGKDDRTAVLIQVLPEIF